MSLDELLRQGGPVPDGVAKQLGAFNGGIPQECPTPVEPTMTTPETSPPVVPAVAVPDRVLVPGFLTVCLPGFPTADAVTFVVTDPAGRASTFPVPAGWDTKYGVDVYLGVGRPQGRYRIRATQGGTSAEAEFPVERVTQPVIWIHPDRVRAGSAVEVQLGGFPSGEPATLHLYSAADGPMIRYRASVDVRVNLVGEAQQTLRTTTSTEPGKYYLHSPLQRETSGPPGSITAPSFRLRR
ncbi:hypothetical protein AB0F81_06300 [Actinoplanes sp. NPDC024001]|uniref:hypothetical protein n=1 Tax=Actinoplanes sp. NPDC024001 TaxID=3154598 RepID=UPI0033F8666B